jgi:hypothetical protein
MGREQMQISRVLPALRSPVLLAAAAALLAGPASAQEPDSLRERYIVPAPPAGLLAPGLVLLRTPGLNLNSPIGFGPSWGEVFVGAVAVNRQRYFPDRGYRDGVAAVGLGLGNPVDLAGVEVLLVSYTTVNTRFLSRGGVNVKVHRVLPGQFGVAVGMENLLEWGEVDPDRSIFGAVSRVWLPSGGEIPILITSVGVGTGRFRSEADWLEDRRTVGVFGSAALSFWQPLSFIADYNQDLHLGVSIVPIPRGPISITAGVLDVLGRAGDGHRFMLGVAAGYSFTR